MGDQNQKQGQRSGNQPPRDPQSQGGWPTASEPERGSQQDGGQHNDSDREEHDRERRPTIDRDR